MLDVTMSVVLIDDDPTLLRALAKHVRLELDGDNVEVREWSPQEGEDPLQRFDQLVDDHTVAVVTDFDLTSRGLTGLFGATIVNWCQSHLLPVADFSRANVAQLPTEPNLFELRVPTDTEQAARYTGSLVRGFKQIRRDLASDEARLAGMRSPAEALATVLDRPHLEGQFALYMSRLGAANSTLLERLRTELSSGDSPEMDEKARLLTYVIGHVLVNAVLRYPGPILTSEALCAYLATSETEADALGEAFKNALYEGPFASQAQHFWRREVDKILETAAADIDESAGSLGEFNRALAQKILGRELTNHSCPRCGGTNGGFLCPFTSRAVCDRADCSVAANSWIPAGADLCRIERDFYDEWAPLIGL